MYIQRVILIICLCACFTICNYKESMSKELRTNITSDKTKETTSWLSVTVLSDIIVFAGQSGKIVIQYPGKSQKLVVQTDLDLPTVAATNTGFAAIGRWNTQVLSWNSDSKEERILSSQLFTGRSNALCYYNFNIYISGADKDTTENPNNIDGKDDVHLLPGILYAIASTGEIEKVNINAEGQITHLLVGNGWKAWIDNKYDNSLRVKSEKNGIHHFECATPITSVCADDESIYFVDSKGIYAVNPVPMNKESLYQFKKINFQILKLIKVKDCFYGLTSEGVFKFPGEIKINKKKGQPIDMAAWKDEISVLWQDGSLEYIKNDGTIVRDSID